MVPAAVALEDGGTTEAWRLFDRSAAEAFAVDSARRVEVALPGEVELVYIKVLGAAPARLEVLGESFDLSGLDPGWNLLSLAEPVIAGELSLALVPLAAGAEVAEIELWATDPGRQNERIARSDTAEATLGPDARCASFPVDLAEDPSVYASARLEYEAEHLFRPFSLSRSINGSVAFGGVWLSPSDGTDTFSQAVDPDALRLGTNAIELCLPEATRESVTVRDLHVIGVVETTRSLVTLATVGDTPAPAVRDDDASTEVGISPSSPLSVSFARLVAPDAIAFEPASAAALTSWSISCETETGAWRPVATTDTAGQLLLLDGAALRCKTLSAIPEAPVTVADVRVLGSGAHEAIDWPTIFVTSRREHFGTAAWVAGFAKKPGGMTGPIQVAVSSREVPSLSGDFGRVLERSGDPDAPWTVEVEATFPDGSQITETVVLGERALLATDDASGGGGEDSDDETASDPRYGNPGQSAEERVSPTDAARIRLGSHVGVDVPAGAVHFPTTISVTHLGEDQLPPLDPGLINVTAPGGRAYEFLPHGIRFRRPVEVIVPFDPALLPEGKQPSDVQTYFYDEIREKWVPLTRASVDVGRGLVRSKTDHFTVMINAVLAVPEHSKLLSFDPTALSSLTAATPTAMVDVIEPPVVGSSGDANLALPIRLPPGRGQVTPSLGLSYSSSRENGWLGIGWDLPISRIQIDTRFGVPSYAAGEEPRYLLDGQALVPTAETDGPRCQSGGHPRRYRTRVEGEFLHILRCGQDAQSYHFEVRDRRGTLYIYGDHAGSGSDSAQGGTASLASYRDDSIFSWHLRRVEDVHGNVAHYRYAVINGIPEDGGEPFRQIYPSSISYTTHPAATNAPYRVELVLDDGSRPDAQVSGRAGFKVVTDRLLRRVRVLFQDDVVREYVLTYKHGQFTKSLLESVRVYGAGGCAASADAFSPPTCPGSALFHEHRLDYYDDQPTGFAPPVAWHVDADPNPTRSALGKGHSESVKGSVSLGLGSADSSVALSASGSLGDRDELVGMYDVNGDGLPDQVFDQGGSLMVLYNQFSRGLRPGAALFSPAGPTLVGLSALGHEAQRSWSLGLQASAGSGGSGVAGSLGLSNSTSRAERFLTDLNGDGFLDLVKSDGEALLGHPCAQGMCFSPESFATTDVVDPKNDPLLRDYANEIAERLFLGDPVVQWVAPFSGRISVTGTAHKGAAGGQDGIVVELYHQDSLLDAVSFGPDETAPAPLPSADLTLDVTAGEALYVRVKTLADHGIDNEVLHDLATAHLAVSYERVCAGPWCTDISDPFAAREPTGRPVLSFDSAEDFRLAGTPTFVTATFEGTLDLSGALDKRPSAANLRTCVQRFRRPPDVSSARLDVGCDESAHRVANVSGTLHLPAADSGVVPLDVSIDVQPGDVILLRVEADLSFDPAKVSFRTAFPGAPALRYTRACLPTGEDSIECTSDRARLAKLPLNVAQFGPYVPLPDPATGGPRMPLVADRDGELSVGLSPVPDEPFLFAVRSDRQGLIEQLDCSATSCANFDIAPIPVTDGESITFELVSESGASGAMLFASYDGVALTSARLYERAFDRPPRAETPFAGGYRGFHYGLWNERIDFAPTALLADLDVLELLPDSRQQDIDRSMMTPRPHFHGSLFTGNAPAWAATGSAAFATADSLHAGPVGAALLAPDGSVADHGDILADDDYARLSGTRSYYFGAGFQVADIADVSLSLTFSDTKTTTDVVDLNGDGVGDVVAGTVAAEGKLGVDVPDIAGALLPGLSFTEPLRQRKGHDYSIGFDGHAVKPSTTSSGRSLSSDSDEPPSGGLFGLGGGVGLGIGRSQTVADLVDMNGDGLPDRVTRSGSQILVQLNLGHRFGAPEPFGLVHEDLQKDVDTFAGIEQDYFGLDSSDNALEMTTTITRHVSKGFDFGVVSAMSSSLATSSRTTMQLADINGDGLSDLLFKKSGEPLQVQLGQGAGLATKPITWRNESSWPIELSGNFDSRMAQLGITGADVLAGTGRQSGDSYSASVKIPVFPGVTVGGGAAKSEQTDAYELALLDIDGNGTADHVLRRGKDGDPGTVYVKHNRVTGKENLLRRIERPLGGAITLAYERTENTVDMPQSRHVLTRVEVDDGVDLGGAWSSPNQVTTYRYEGGFYDRSEKEFFGFETVVERRADGSEVTRRYHNDQYDTRSRLRSETLTDQDGAVFSRKEIVWQSEVARDVDGAPLSAHPACEAGVGSHPLVDASVCVPHFVFARAEVHEEREGGGLAKVRTVTDTERDRFGNILASHDSGDGEIAGDELSIRVAYENNLDGWILGLPKSISVRAGSETGKLLQSRRGNYDARGQLRTLEVDTGTAVATQRFDYDVFGNLERVTTPPNGAGQVQTLSFLYDAVTHSHVRRVTDGFGLTSSAEYDLRFGAPTTTTDANGQRMTTAYDAFGRTQSIRGPYDGADPAITMSYDLAGTYPRAVTVNRASPPPDYTGPVPPPVTTTVIVDGLGRPIETSKSSVVHGQEGTTVQGPPAYDPRGRPVARFQPFFHQGSATAFVPPLLTLATRFTYDIKGRITDTYFPDGTQQTTRYGIAAAPDGKRLFETRLVDENGHARESYADALGRVRAFVEHPTASSASVTTYDYRATGELSAILDAEGNRSSFSHDLRGLLTRIENPDTGLIERRYDLMGNLAALVEPNHRAAGTEVRYLYDRDRLVGIDFPQKQDVTFRYGEAGAPHGRAGRVAEVADETGRMETFYGALGEVRRTVREVDPHAPGRRPVIFDTRSVADSLGRVLRMTYPDGEVVTNVYDRGGKLISVAGAGAGWQTVYASGLEYEVFGNQTRAVLGNGVVQTWRFDPRRVRLEAATAELPTGTPIQDLHYDYDGVGNPTAIESRLPAPGPSDELPGPGTWRFGYDGVDRLVSATGQATLAPGKISAFGQTFSYSPSHNLLRKARTHMIAQPSGLPVAPPHTNIDYAYAFDGPRPHAPTQVGDLLLAYDPSGNVIRRRNEGTGAIQHLSWDDDGRLVEVRGQGTHQRNYYDASGTRVLRRGTHGETIFASPHFDLEGGRRAAKHIFAGKTRVATVLSHYQPPTTGGGHTPPGQGGTPPGQGGTPPGQDSDSPADPDTPPQPDKPGHAFYFTQDHLGSTAVLTDQDGTVHEHLQYFPDGELWIDRGPRRPVNGYLFSGKPFDPETGFYDFGQRFYDPKTSLWLGVDPAFTDSPTLSVRRPFVLSPLAYARHNPLRFIDPNGRHPMCGYKNGCFAGPEDWEDSASIDPLFFLRGLFEIGEGIGETAAMIYLGQYIAAGDRAGELSKDVAREATLGVLTAGAGKGLHWIFREARAAYAAGQMADETFDLGAGAVARGGGALARVPDFANPAAAFRHYAKHAKGVVFGKRGRITVKPGGPDVPEFSTFAEYRAAARSFHSGPPGRGVLEGVRANGDFVRFDPSTGYFGVRTSDGTIRTFFRPKGSTAQRLQYFREQF